MATPDVYKSATSDTYVVFGEAKVEDLNAQAAAQQALMKSAANTGNLPTVAEDMANATPAAKIQEEDDGEAVDETGVEPKDIELVMAQANVTRAKAVKALKAADNDIVNAIMDLTM